MIKKRKLITFDWAIKRLLCSKVNQTRLSDKFNPIDLKNFNRHQQRGASLVSD